MKDLLLYMAKVWSMIPTALRSRKWKARPPSSSCASRRRIWASSSAARAGSPRRSARSSSPLPSAPARRSALRSSTEPSPALCPAERGVFCIKGSPSRGAGAQRLRGCCRFAAASCLRRPHLFSRKRKDGGEKSAWTRLVRSASEFRQASMFWMSFHTRLTLRASWYAPPDTEGIRFVTSCLRTTAINRRCD